MSYGNIYILSEISKLKAHGFNKQRVINLIANRINSRYPEISITRGKVIAKKLYEGQLPSQADWKMGKRIKLVEDDYPLVVPRKGKKFSAKQKKKLDVIAKDVYEKAMDSIEIDYGKATYVSHETRMEYLNAETARYPCLDDDEYEYVLKKADKG